MNTARSYTKPQDHRLETVKTHNSKSREKTETKMTRVYIKRYIYIPLHPLFFARIIFSLIVIIFIYILFYCYSLYRRRRQYGSANNRWCHSGSRGRIGGCHYNDSIVFKKVMLVTCFNYISMSHTHAECIFKSFNLKFQ